MSYLPNPKNAQLLSTNSLGAGVAITPGADLPIASSKISGQGWYNPIYYNATKSTATHLTALSGGASLTTRALLAAWTDPVHGGTPYSWVSTTVYQLTDAMVASGLYMDYLGIQSAIVAAAAAGGGDVYIPAGNYYLNKTVVVLETTTSNALPPASSAQVNVIGAGTYATCLHASSDFGSGFWLISCGDPTATKSNLVGRMGANSYDGIFEDFSVIGPTTTAITFGTAPCSMSGIAWGNKRKAVRVAAQFFYSGHDITGNGTSYQDLTAYNCYYGIYLYPSNTTLYGNLTFINPTCYQNAMAAIGVSKDAVLNGLFLGGTLSYSPYSILGEAGASDSYGQPYAGGNTPLVVETIFQKTDFIALGNGWILDDNATNASSGGNTNSKTRECDNLICENANILPYGSGAPSTSVHLTTGGRGFYAYLDVLACYKVEIKGVPAYSMPPVTGMNSAIQCAYIDQFYGGLLISGDLTQTMASYSSTIPFLGDVGGNLPYTLGYQATVIEEPNRWRGGFALVSTSSAIVVGNVLEATLGTSVPNNGWQLAGTATAGTVPIMGVAVQPMSASSSGKLVAYANCGTVTVKIGSTTNFSGSGYCSLYPTTPGTIQHATAGNAAATVGFMLESTDSYATGRVRLLFPGGF